MRKVIITITAILFILSTTISAYGYLLNKSKIDNQQVVNNIYDEINENLDDDYEEDDDYDYEEDDDDYEEEEDDDDDNDLNGEFYKNIGGYDIFIVKSSIDYDENRYYVTIGDNKENIIKADNNNDIFVLLDDCSHNRLFNFKENIMYDKYDEYNCEFNSDVSFSTCENSNTIIVNKSKKNNYYSGLLNLENNKLLLECIYDEINELSNGRFIFKKDKKYGLFDLNNGIVLEDFDLLFYNNYFGYIALKNEKLLILDENLNDVNLEENTIFNLYLDSLNEYKDSLDKNDELYEEYIESSCILFNNSDKTWSSGAYLCYGDMNKFEDDFSLEYLNDTYVGKQLFIYTGCYDEKTYIIDNNNLIKIKAKTSQSCF